MLTTPVTVLSASKYACFDNYSQLRNGLLNTTYHTVPFPTITVVCALLPSSVGLHLQLGTTMQVRIHLELAFLGDMQGVYTRSASVSEIKRREIFFSFWWIYSIPAYGSHGGGRP